MPWLYEHRDQLNGLQPLVEIAHWVVISHVPPEDQDDVEQEIVIRLLQVVHRHGIKPRSYLRAVARNGVHRYLRQKYKEATMLHHIFESERGEMVRGMWKLLHDGDGRLDAIATLATLPRRLIEIGYKRLNGEKLSEADQSYERRQRAKLNCRRHANRLSHWEKRRILQLHSEGLSMSRIARTLERSNKAVMRVLAGNRLSRQEWLSRMKAAAQQRDEQIRVAYLQGKGISQITRELHVASATVQKIARAERQRETARAAGAVF